MQLRTEVVAFVSGLLVHSILLDHDWFEFRLGTPGKQLVASEVAEILHVLLFLVQLSLESCFSLLLRLVFLNEVVHPFLVQFLLEELY